MKRYEQHFGGESPNGDVPYCCGNLKGTINYKLAHKIQVIREQNNVKFKEDFIEWYVNFHAQPGMGNLDMVEEHPELWALVLKKWAEKEKE